MHLSSSEVLSCSTTLATGCTDKSRGIVVGSVQAVAAIANDESLQVRVRKAHPPKEGHLCTLWHTKVPKRGVL